jgi:hypothetical protein
VQGEGVDVLATPNHKVVHISDHLAVVAGAVLFLMLALLALLLYLNTMADIKHWDGAKNGVLAVYNLDTIHDVAAAATKKDKDDLLETYAAVDSIERAVQHGNIAGARMVLQQLIGSNTLQASDVAALTKLIEDAEAENPIIDIAACRAPNALNFVKEKGGSIISEGKGEEADWALMMADFDHDQQQADGRGRGIAALKEIKEGEVLLEVPGGAQMSIKSAASTPKLEHIFKAESRASGGVLGSFNGLALFLLHESHRTDSYFRPYICSLPLHVPLPFLWADTDLPPDFLADHKIVADRKMVRELVELSYNVTVPPMLEKYPEVFKAEHFSTSKWAWACSIILSRALALGASAGTSQLLDAEVIDPAVVLQALKDPAQVSELKHEPPSGGAACRALWCLWWICLI